MGAALSARDAGPTTRPKAARSSSLRRLYASARGTSWRRASASSTAFTERGSVDDEEIARDGRGRSPGVRWGASTKPARADADRFAVQVHQSTVTAAVCDGHGVAGDAHWGREIAGEACEALVAADDVVEGFEAFQEIHEARYDRTVGAAFAKRRASFLEEHGFAAPCALPAEGGCTATVARAAGGVLTVAWVGDSRCVLALRDGTCRPLTRDHAAASHVEEGARIEAAGGAVEGAYVAAPRAEGLLQVTRSLGDRAHHLDGVVLATPELVEVPTEGAAFAILATDGVWAFLDDARAVACVSDALATAPGDVRAAAAALVALARDRADASARGADDVAVVVLVFV